MGARLAPAEDFVNSDAEHVLVASRLQQSSELREKRWHASGRLVLDVEEGDAVAAEGPYAEDRQLLRVGRWACTPGSVGKGRRGHGISYPLAAPEQSPAVGGSGSHLLLDVDIDVVDHWDLREGAAGE